MYLILKFKVSKLLEIMSRCDVSHDILFRWNSEDNNLEIKCCYNQNNCLKRTDCRFFNKEFMKTFHDDLIVACNANSIADDRVWKHVRLQTSSCIYLFIHSFKLSLWIYIVCASLVMHVYFYLCSQFCSSLAGVRPFFYSIFMHHLIILIYLLHWYIPMYALSTSCFLLSCHSHFRYFNLLSELLPLFSEFSAF